MAVQTFAVPLSRYARICGWLYLLIIVAGMAGELFVRGGLIIPGDANATAQNIAAAPLLFRSGIAGDLLMHVCDVPLLVFFYFLLRPVSRELSLMAAAFNLVQTSVLVANKIALLSVLALVSGSGSLGGFTEDQSASLGWLLLHQHAQGFAVGLIFFGLRCLLVGWLMVRSGYLPRWLGVLQIFAGLAYLVNSFGELLVPMVVGRLQPAILLPAFVAELSMAVWLIAAKKETPAWREASAGV